jgi:hypothetical protein
MSGDVRAPRHAADDISPDDIDGSFVPRARPDVGAVVVDREIVLGLVVDESAWLQSAGLNESASIVWHCFDGSGTIDEIAGDIASVFGAETAGVRADVLTLARAVGGAGFLVGVHEPVIDVRDDTINADTTIGVGTPFPDFTAVDDQGVPFSTATRHAGQALLVSWSTTCEFCARIAPDLASLTPAFADANIDIVRLVTADSIDGFAGLGTPVAYLVDDRGRVAEPAALGAAAVLALARRIVSNPA